MSKHSSKAFVAVTALLCSSVTVAGTADARDGGDNPLRKIKHIVVIYEENHSFDNLYGGWEGVNGLANADAAHTTQVDINGAPLPCLPQNEVNLASPTPLPTTCSVSAGTKPGTSLSGGLANAPFAIDDYIAPTDSTCPPALQAFSFPNGILKGQPPGQPGGCTRDLVHKFYHEQYQINGGQMNRYVTGSDAIGLTMGHYDTTALPIYKYLHGEDAPNYAIADNFFQAAFGGSFLNHQWLIAARTPVLANAPATLHAVLTSDGHPRNNYPLHTVAEPAVDGALTVAAAADGSCSAPTRLPVCGDFAINTMTPPFPPTAAFAPTLSPQSYDTIGDRLSAKGVGWAWYAGGWDNATGNVSGVGFTGGPGPTCANVALAGSTWPTCTDALFQQHHQPFNYFANYAPGTAARAAHLRDEAEFIDAAKQGKLKPVSFVKPVGAENEHPGYTNEHDGSDHLVELIKAIHDGPDGEDTMIVVTYDEFGGAWDHVSPPTGAGVSDAWGPGTRVPALVIADRLPEDFVVDHVSHDTTSILSTIEHRFGLAPLTSRDASVSDLSSVFRAGRDGNGHHGD